MNKECNTILSLEDVAKELGVSIEKVTDAFTTLSNKVIVEGSSSEMSTMNKLEDLTDRIVLSFINSGKKFDIDKNIMFLYDDIGEITHTIEPMWDTTASNDINKKHLLDTVGVLLWNCIVLNHNTEDFTNMNIYAAIMDNKNKVADSSLYSIRNSFNKLTRRHVMECINLVYKLGFTFEDVYNNIIDNFEN